MPSRGEAAYTTARHDIKVIFYLLIALVVISISLFLVGTARDVRW